LKNKPAIEMAGTLNQHAYAKKKSKTEGGRGFHPTL